jgi:hypothetical protein
VQTLRRLWLQQYYRDPHGLRWRSKSELPPGALAIGSPYDPEARYGIKHGVGWRGYKAHFTETCEPDRPHLIVHVATTVAAANDVDTVAARHADLARGDLLPDEHLVDAGYVSVDHVLGARTDHGIELVGPLPPDAGWQARQQQGFDLTRCHIDWDRQQVTCPNGKTSRNWHDSRSRQGLPIVQVSFRLHALPRPRPLHPLGHPRSRPDLPSARPVRGPTPAPRRAGHRRLAGVLCPPCRDRGHHRPGHPPCRPPPGALPRAGQDPPAARADRAGAQLGPGRRLAQRHPAWRHLGLAPNSAPSRAATYVNSPAESIWWTHERLRAASPRRSSRATHQTALPSSVPR